MTKPTAGPYVRDGIYVRGLGGEMVLRGMGTTEMKARANAELAAQALQVVGEWGPQDFEAFKSFTKKDRGDA